MFCNEYITYNTIYHIYLEQIGLIAKETMAVKAFCNFNTIIQFWQIKTRPCKLLQFESSVISPVMKC